MPSFGEIITNPLGVYIAPLNTDDSFGTPQLVDYVQSVNLSFETDDDKIKAYGMNLEAGSWLIGAEVELEEAALSTPAKLIATGYTEALSGVSPNQLARAKALAGGPGKPYIAIVVVFAAKGGSAAVLGFPKSILKEDPEWEVEQNKFRTGEMSFDTVVPDQIKRELYVLERYESASDLPDFTLAASFDALMGDMF